MSPLRMGSATVAEVTSEDLAARVDALRAGLESGGAELDPQVAGVAQVVVDKVRSRTAIAGDHTVVALAGATGSGKSSLFNALTQTGLAVVGARRPTTSSPVAAVWGDQPANALLDWLGIGTRHAMETDESNGRGSVGGLEGLVLVDLPDFDSRIRAHRDEAERLLERVDLFVWVTDPQKYADSRLHDDYIAALKEHEANTLIVLNQTDRLTRDQLRICLGDLTRLVQQDGIASPTVLATSTVDGQGLDELRQRLTNSVAAHHLSRHRLAADVKVSASRLRADVHDTEPTLDDKAQRGLVGALSTAAGVPTVVDAVERDYHREAVARTGWLFTRWVARLKPDPLKRLRLKRSDLTGMSRSEVRSVLGRSSLPKATPTARATVDLATDELRRRAGSGLPMRWTRAVAAATEPGDEDLADALDQAVMGTSLEARNPFWWMVFGIIQVVLGIVAVLGLVWLAVLAVLGWLQLPDIDTPSFGPFALPLLMLVGGLATGLLLAVLARPLASVGSRRRGRLIAERMRESISGVAMTHIVQPVRAVLARHALTRESLDRAQG